MNKFFFPTTLAAVLVIAAVFAIAPVEYAQTTHLPTIGTGQIADNSITAADIATGAVATDEILLDTILAVDIATGAVATDEILDDTIGPEDVTGSADAAALLRIERISTGADTLAASTPGYTPIVLSTVLATCTASGTNDATIISAGTMQLAEDQAGLIQGAATRIISDVPASDVWSASHSWITTGVPIAVATVFTCTLGGTGLVAADVDEIELITVWFPQ